jgi:membrane peptidoglycan carboxypeptidase
MKKFLLAAGSIVALAVICISLWFLFVLRNLPDVSVLKRYRPAAATEVLDREGKPLVLFSDRAFRVWIPIPSIPDIVIRSVVIAEDDTFFGHEGVNYKAVWEALQKDIEKKRFARGGSTITQQMIKNVLLSKEKTLARKIREFVLARRAEEILSKRRILEIYLNEVEWGDGIYGIEAASRFYFDKHTDELSAAEAALLAGMLPNPRYYNPFKRMDKARHRQEQVLFNMHQAKILNNDEYQTALAASIVLRTEGSTRFDFAVVSDQNRPCWQRALEQILLTVYGEHDLYRKGLRIRTSLDKSLQTSMSARCDAQNGRRSDLPESITLVREGASIRAILCAPDDAALRDFLSGFFLPPAAYDASTETLSDIDAGVIITTETDAH